jgi:hypothetical protein
MGKVNATIHNVDITGPDTFDVVDNNLNGGTEIGPVTIGPDGTYPVQLEQDGAGWGDCTITNVEEGSVPNAFHIVHDGDRLDV